MCVMGPAGVLACRFDLHVRWWHTGRRARPACPERCGIFCCRSL